MKAQHTSWVEVNLAAIRHNYGAVRRHAGVPVMAVLKTNAYGHGLELVADALRDEAGWFGVSTLEEGIRLRAVAPGTPTLVFHPVGPWNAEGLVRNRLTASVDSVAGAQALAEAGRGAGVVPEAHIKIDTGMCRFGIRPEDGESLARVVRTPGVRFTGAYTHLATAAEKGDAAARAQLVRFHNAVSILRTEGFEGEAIHALNSAGLLRFPESRYAMVRCGTLLYGQYPSAHVPRPLDLLGTFAWKTRIVSIRRVPAGAAVGYGGEWVARQNSVIATIPVGYFDGLTVEPLSVWKRQGGLKGLAKRLTGRGRIAVRTACGAGPVVGRVAAQSATLDVTGLDGIAVGDVVEVCARRVLVGDHVPRVPVEAVGQAPQGLG